jgi:exodeoxyribonuclease VII large subunit
MMTEQENDRKIFSLLDVTKSIQKTLSERYKSMFWVKAEMNKLNHYKHSGHCYPELVEKQSGKIVAQVKACLWREDYVRTNRKFEAILREPLKDGIKILFLAKIIFDPAHGLSLLIMDIDPSYTLGDLEREKQETIQKLKEEGILDKNRQLRFPMLPQRLAIISVETSKGFADFSKIIDTNPWKYRFFKFLFPSVLQGDNAAPSIIYQLKKIKKIMHHFDAVSIIRGGGGDVGLSCYNNYDLAREIALFPLPVITGVGHATNETVAEIVSYYNAITPTKLAEFLLQKFHDFSIPVQDAERKIRDRALHLINEHRAQFHSEIKLFRSVTENALMDNHNNIKSMSQSIRKDINSQITRTKHVITQMTERLRGQGTIGLRNKLSELNYVEKNVHNMSPENVLRRGYSITFVRSKSIASISDVTVDDIIETVVADGKILSTVKSANPKE